MTAAKAVEAFVNTVDAAAASYMEACVHCGQCARACPFYETENDPRLTPIHKIEPLLKAYKRHKAPFAGLRRMLGLAPAEVTEDELNEWSELVYDTCTMCGRCTLVCPMGIDIAALVRKTREGFVAAGIVPEGLVGAAQRALDIGSPLGIKPETLRKIVNEQVEEVGIPIELDKEGADYLVVLSAMELLNFYEVIGALARIFKQAGVSWTISTKAYEATNIGIQMGDKAIARTLVGRIVDAAEELKVKYVISPECGHAYTALKWEGPNLVGRSYDFKVVHILREGRIRTSGKDTRRVTYHDPCQIVRRGGVVKQPRTILNKVSDGFVEMSHAGVANICCGGGGGVSSNPRAEEHRLKAFASKKKQIDDLEGIEALVTSCANCRNVIEEAIDEYGMELPVIGLVELLADYLEPDGAGEKAKLAEA
jgi:Fe-S oxidoreductase